MSTPTTLQLFEQVVETKIQKSADISDQACCTALATFSRTIKTEFFTRLGDAIAKRM